MPVRKPSLGEWFYIYVHHQLWQGGFFVPGFFNIDLPEPRVAVPVMFERDGKMYTKIELVKSPHQKTVPELRQELRELRKKPVPPVTLFCLTRRNYFLNRWLLKLVFTVLKNLPSVIERFTAGVSVSSLLALSEPGMSGRSVALGPNALCFTLSEVETTPDGKAILHLGVGYNHLVCRGDESFVAGRYMWHLLTGQTALGLTPFLP